MKKKKLKGGLSSVKDSTWLDSVLKQGLSEAPNVKWPKAIHFEDGGGAGGDAGGDAGGADAGSSDGGDNDSGGNEPPSPFSSYDSARDYFSTRQNWDATSLAGLSSREPFNFNALWGGTQYARGRVTDFSHIDSTQYKANKIASDTRTQLWDTYEKATEIPTSKINEILSGARNELFTSGMSQDVVDSIINQAYQEKKSGLPDEEIYSGLSEGIKNYFAENEDGQSNPLSSLINGDKYNTISSITNNVISKIDQASQILLPKNPDQVALDFYVKNVGQNGSGYGYGPGVNTVLLSESLKSQFLNQPRVSSFTGKIYQPSQKILSFADSFGKAREAAVPTWQVFEQQGISKDRFGSLIPMIIGGLALGPLGGAFGGGLAGNALAGALIGGVTSEIGGGDFGKGFLTGGLGAGLTGGLSGAFSGASAALQEFGLSQAIADAAIRAGSKAIMAGSAGGDVESAIMGSIVGSGVGGVSGEYLPADIAKYATPLITTALMGGDIQSSLIKSGLSFAKDGSWGVNPQSGSGGDAEAQDGGFYGIPSYYESLGYDPETIKQLYEGTYSGSEQTEAEAREQLGDLYDLAYPDGFPTSSSSYEGLGYDANTINQLINGTYSGPEQTEAEVREQMGDELFKLAYPNGYNAAVNRTTGGTGGGAGGTGGGTGGTGGGTTGGTTGGGLASTLKNVNESLFPKDQGSSAVVPMSSLRPTMISTGQPTQSNTPEYSQIIGQLASILGKRGYKVGGSVHVPGPEGRFYEKHETRGFAVGGPGTGQSDDIPTMLSDGEYVFDADTVAALGDGSSKAGAKVLDLFREEIRNHKRSASTDRIPPKAKNPLAYLKAAQKAKG